MTARHKRALLGWSRVSGPLERSNPGYVRLNILGIASERASEEPGPHGYCFPPGEESVRSSAGFRRSSKPLGILPLLLTLEHGVLLEDGSQPSPGDEDSV